MRSATTTLTVLIGIHQKTEKLKCLFVTDSKAHFNQRPWFDMKEKDIRELANHPAAFVVFILGEDSNYLVIPAKYLAAELPNHNEGRTEDGFYHFNIVLGQQGFKQLPNWSLHQYRNKFEFITSALNAPCDEKSVATGLLLN
ncbi:MAG TPA: hypothetical protein VFC17_12505 [Candidatus Limnocylindrales bacterium]|nr:hypothetical protein [Candidatus Limnocylindrales bacterium]